MRKHDTDFQCLNAWHHHTKCIFAKCLKAKMLFCCNAIIPSVIPMRVIAPKLELKCWNIKMKNKAFLIKNILEIQVLNRQK